MRRTTLTGPRGLRLSVEIPETRRERARGLLGRDSLPSDGAMLFPRTRSVHTIGMRFPLAVAFLDRDLVVVRVKRMPPGLWPTLPRRRVRAALEAPDGTDIRPDDRLELSERN